MISLFRLENGVKELYASDNYAQYISAMAKFHHYSFGNALLIRIGFCVRRLTPLEAERLQGFPDYWTECDDEGELISDTKRYQMLGNSVAVPCVAYIMQGIRDALNENE